MLRNPESPDRKPRLSSTDSKTSVVSGMSLGAESTSGEIIDEIGDLKLKGSFKTRHNRETSIRTRVMMNPFVDIIKENDRHIKNKPKVKPLKEQDNISSNKMDESGSNSRNTTVVQLHRSDSTGSEASQVNIRI